MNLYINGSLVDVTLENEKTVGDVLHSFEEYCEQNHVATIGIKLNDQLISADQFDSITTKPLKNDTKIDLTVISEEEVRQSLESLKKPFEDIQKDIQEIPVQLQSGKDTLAHKTISYLADLIDQLCHSVTFSAVFPEKLAIIKIGDKSTGDFFSDFSQVLGDFKNALETKDTVTIGDLAEYEICPRIDSIAKSLGEIHE